MQKERTGTPFNSFSHARGRALQRSLRPLLFLLLVSVFLSALPTKTQATDLVYDPVNWGENVLQYIQHLNQTSIQSTISATETTISQITSVISQYTKYIFQLENLLQQATGTVANKAAFIQGLYSELSSIPTSFENAFQGILNMPNNFMNSLNGPSSGWGTYSNSTNPIDRYLGSALASIQRLLGGLNNIGNVNSIPYNSSQYAANLNQALAAQVLKNSNDTNQTITALQTRAKAATTLQSGQSVNTSTGILDLAARNQHNTIEAAGNIYEVQNQDALDKYNNTIIAGKEEAGMANLYDGFNP